MYPNGIQNLFFDGKNVKTDFSHRKISMKIKLKNKEFGPLTGRLLHSTTPILFTKSGPLGTSIRFSFESNVRDSSAIPQNRPVQPIPSSRVGRDCEHSFDQIELQ